VAQTPCTSGFEGCYGRKGGCFDDNLEFFIDDNLDNKDNFFGSSSLWLKQKPERTLSLISIFIKICVVVSDVCLEKYTIGSVPLCTRILNVVLVVQVVVKNT
jgi:hypothetical protein